MKGNHTVVGTIVSIWILLNYYNEEYNLTNTVNRYW